MKEIEKYQFDFDEKSEELNVLINDPPKWYLRSGFSLMFLLLCFILIACYYIEYPEYIISNVQIVSRNPRIPIIAKTDGHIEELKKEYSQIFKDEIIAVINNPANTEDLLKVNKILDSISNQNFYVAPLDLNLGEIQSAYTNFLISKKEFDIINLKHDSIRLENFQEEINSNKNLIKSLRREKKLQQDNLELAKIKFDRSKKLFEKGVIAEQEFEEVKKEYIDRKRSSQGKNSNILEIEVRNQSIMSNLNNTDISALENETRALANYKTSISQLRSSIEQWKKKYLLISPIDGIIIFNNVWSNNQSVKSGEEIGSVVPKDESIFALAKMPEGQSGKVRTGNEVQIFLNSYNYAEYGMIIGTVKKISPVPYEGLYRVEINLKNRLTTDLGYNIPFAAELNGRAEILTEKMNLLERLFYTVKRLFKGDKLAIKQKEQNNK